MQNAVYIRLILYVVSTLLGLIPASVAGYVSYDAETSMLSVNIEAIATALVSGGVLSGIVFKMWGTK